MKTFAFKTGDLVQPRYASSFSDYSMVLEQRDALLESPDLLSTLTVMTKYGTVKVVYTMYYMSILDTNTGETCFPGE